MKEQQEIKQWLAVRKEAGLLIDPATAEVDWNYGVVGDPYNIGHIPREEECIGRQYFARAPGSDIWVAFDDLPAEVEAALWEKHKSKLGFPAGLRTEEPERSSYEDDSFGVYLLNWLITQVDAVSPGMFWAHGDMPIGRADTVKRLETALNKLTAIKNAAPE